MELAKTIGLFSAFFLYSYQAGVEKAENELRSKYWLKARILSRKLGKPLLVVGRPKGRHGCGDVTLDIAPKGECPCEVQGDVRNMHMFSDKQFGSAFCSHVLEHLPPEDVDKAIGELTRVAHYAVILYPSKYSLIARFHPDHKLRSLQILWSKNPLGVLEIYDSYASEVIGLL